MPRRHKCIAGAPGADLAQPNQIWRTTTGGFPQGGRQTVDLGDQRGSVQLAPARVLSGGVEVVAIYEGNPKPQWTHLYERPQEFGIDNTRRPIVLLYGGRPF
jgi:hypothetical protein